MVDINESILNESILDTVKTFVGVDKDETVFDKELILEINSIFLELFQNGIDELKAFCVSDEKEKWSDINITPLIVLLDVKIYICIKVNILFDKSMSSSLVDNYNKIANEALWRINAEKESYNE